jgi:hypothetical protein
VEVPVSETYATIRYETTPDRVATITLDRPYRAAMEQGLLYTRLGNPIGMAEVQRTPPLRRTPRIR